MKKNRKSNDKYLVVPYTRENFKKLELVAWKEEIRFRIGLVAVAFVVVVVVLTLCLM